MLGTFEKYLAKLKKKKNLSNQILAKEWPVHCERSNFDLFERLQDKPNQKKNNTNQKINRGHINA